MKNYVFLGHLIATPLMEVDRRTTLNKSKIIRLK